MTRLLVSVALVSSLAACNGQIIGSGGNGGNGDCGSPPPPSGGWCPPSWACIDGKWQDTSGACPDPECPTSKPADGSPCPMIGQECVYFEDVPCGPSGDVTATCTYAGWLVPELFCQPEPICPDDLPVVGGDCTEWPDAYACSYSISSPCGDSYVGIYCDYNTMTWQASQLASACDCSGLDPASCGATTDCQWLVPGCGMSPIAEGCYATTGCDQPNFMCPLDTECVEKQYDPCVNLDCNSCSAPFFVCEPTMAGG